MKKHFVTLVVAVSVTLMILSLAIPVNHVVQLPGDNGVVLVADGVPGPPVPPPPPPPSQS